MLDLSIPLNQKNASPGISSPPTRKGVHDAPPVESSYASSMLTCQPPETLRLLGGRYGPNPHYSGSCRHRSERPREESPPQRDEHAGSKNLRPIETMWGVMWGAPTILKVAMPTVEIRADSQHK